MAYNLALLDYKQRMLLPDGSYKGILETSDGFILQDLHRGVNVGVCDSFDKALLLGHAYKLNLLQSTPESNTSDSSMGVAIQAPKDTPDNLTETSFEAYCALFTNPKNKSGYRFITDQTESTGWVILKDGRSEYGRYGSVQEALEEAFKANLNL